MSVSPYDASLDKTAANFSALTPIDFLPRAAASNRDRTTRTRESVQERRGLCDGVGVAHIGKDQHGQASPSLASPPRLH